MTTYRITHDPQSGAFYIRLREGTYDETIPLGDPGLGAGVDVDAEGNVLGLEFLSFEEFAEVIADRGGALELPERFRASDPSDSVPDDETLRGAIDSLPQRHREVLRLRYFEGLSYAEVAARLGISVSSTYSLLHDALRGLGRELAQEGESDVMDEDAIEEFLSSRTIRS